MQSSVSKCHRPSALFHFISYSILTIKNPTLFTIQYEACFQDEYSGALLNSFRMSPHQSGWLHSRSHSSLGLIPHTVATVNWQCGFDLFRLWLSLAALTEIQTLSSVGKVEAAICSSI